MHCLKYSYSKANFYSQVQEESEGLSVVWWECKKSIMCADHKPNDLGQHTDNSDANIIK